MSQYDVHRMRNEFFNLKRFFSLLVFALFVAVLGLALNQLFGVPFKLMQLALAIVLVVTLISFLVYVKISNGSKSKRMSAQEQLDHIKLLSDLEQLQAKENPEIRK